MGHGVYFHPISLMIFYFGIIITSSSIRLIFFIRSSRGSINISPFVQDSIAYPPLFFLQQRTTCPYPGPHKFIPPSPIMLILSFHLRLRLLSGFLIKTLCVFRVSPVGATCPAPLVKVRFLQGVYKRMVRFQKLIRNLLLTLHGHNVHRQQRKLSKFLMRYQQFSSHA